MGVLTKTVHATLHTDLKLSKTVRWQPKLTQKEMKKEQVRMCEEHVAIFAAVS
jgi:hypothetical protein